MNNLRNIKYIVVHCTATPTNTTLESIKRFWKKERGWGDTPGYHFFIERDGNIVQLLEEGKNSNGMYLHNAACINIAYLGGLGKDAKPIDNRSDAQKHAMFDKIVELTERYPNAEVLGHRDFQNVHKASPCFDVKEWLKNYEPDLNNAA